MRKKKKRDCLFGFDLDGQREKERAGGGDYLHYGIINRNCTVVVTVIRRISIPKLHLEVTGRIAFTAKRDNVCSPRYLVDYMLYSFGSCE